MSSEVPGVEHRDPQYFSYYAMLQHQQNMLQDTVRTSTYRSAILLNGPKCFKDKKVLDVGAGSGILSYFAVQAGAEKVYAVEASAMASKMKKLVSAASEEGKNEFLKDKVEVVNAKIETPDLPIPKVDTIISEPIGVLLFHERMLESYIYARDHYLKPGGALLPSKGNIFLAERLARRHSPKRHHSRSPSPRRRHSRDYESKYSRRSPSRHASREDRYRYERSRYENRGRDEKRRDDHHREDRRRHDHSPEPKRREEYRKESRAQQPKEEIQKKDVKKDQTTTESLKKNEEKEEEGIPPNIEIKDEEERQKEEDRLIEERRKRRLAILNKYKETSTPGMFTPIIPSLLPDK
ncbi:Putative S-adenosyl-L-methionine-dependent methyltransferase [Rhizopus microsporus]|nr:Putative S-adenosyl-L-methionine-dependent methyltransferase [Rhizopus microsporus]